MISAIFVFIVGAGIILVGGALGRNSDNRITRNYFQWPKL